MPSTSLSCFTPLAVLLLGGASPGGVIVTALPAEAPLPLDEPSSSSSADSTVLGPHEPQQHAGASHGRELQSSAAAAIFAGTEATIAVRQASRRAHALCRAMWSLPAARRPMSGASATASTSAARQAFPRHHRRRARRHLPARTTSLPTAPPCSSRGTPGAPTRRRRPRFTGR